MTGTISELDELLGGNDGFLSVALMPQFGNGDGARVAAYAETRIIAYVQTWGQIREAGLGRGVETGQPRAGDHEAFAGHFRECAWVRRGDRAHEVVHLLRRLGPVDAAVLGLAPAEVAAASQIVRQTRRLARDQRR